MGLHTTGIHFVVKDHTQTPDFRDCSNIVITFTTVLGILLNNIDDPMTRTSILPSFSLK